MAVSKFTLNPDRRAIVVDDQAIDLTAHEFTIAQLLLRDPGAVVCYDDFYAAMYPDKQMVGAHNVLKVCLSHLRSKLNPFGSRIVTRRGLGVMLDA
jgi:two-component system response regulator PhoP